MTEKKLEFAATARINLLQREVSRIMWNIAAMMKEPDDKETDWLEYCFVSDESSIADFFFEDSEVEELRRRLDLPSLAMRDLICDAAELLHDRARLVH